MRMVRKDHCSKRHISNLTVNWPMSMLNSYGCESLLGRGTNQVLNDPKDKSCLTLASSFSISRTTTSAKLHSSRQFSASKRRCLRSMMHLQRTTTAGSKRLRPAVVFCMHACSMCIKTLSHVLVSVLMHDLVSPDTLLHACETM